MESSKENVKGKKEENKKIKKIAEDLGDESLKNRIKNRGCNDNTVNKNGKN